MGIPPNQPPSNSNSGCLKAFGITCGVLLVLAIVGGIFAVRFVKNSMADKHGLFGQIAGIGMTSANGVQIQKAVVAYHDKHGHYPDTLMDLVSDGQIDGKILHSDMDPNPNPGHVSWQYTKPAEGAPGNTPILKFHFRLNVPTGKNQPPPESDVVINLDGSTPQSHRPAPATRY